MRAFLCVSQGPGLLDSVGDFMVSQQLPEGLHWIVPKAKALQCGCFKGQQFC